MRKEREALVITEIPYQVNKAAMVEKIAELVREKRIEGIADIRDESDRHGMRVVIELKRDAMADVVLNQLYRFSPLQSTFGCNMVALIGGKPEQLNLKDLIRAFTEFREEVVGRRTKFLLRKARDRAHVLVGLAIAVANIDEVIKLIRNAPDPATAREQLMARDWPAKDVVRAGRADRRSAPQGLGQGHLSPVRGAGPRHPRSPPAAADRARPRRDRRRAEEARRRDRRLSRYLALARPHHRASSRTSSTAIKTEFGTPRRTEILEMEGEVEDEDLIQREDMVVTVTHKGYIKRVPLSAYRAQRRGGKGRAGMATREEDFVTRIFIANTHTPVLFFSSRGMAYKMKVWRLPLAAPQARGKALINLLPLDKDETITTILPLPEDEASLGEARRDVRHQWRHRPAQQAVRLHRGPAERQDRHEARGRATASSASQVCNEQHDVLLTTAEGQAIRFPVTDVRVFKGRESAGVRGIKLEGDDQVISMAILNHVEASPAERTAYVRQANSVRRGGAEHGARHGEPRSNGEETVVLTPGALRRAQRA